MVFSLRSNYRYSRIYRLFGDLYRVFFCKFLAFFDLAWANSVQLNSLMHLCSSLQLTFKVCPFVKGFFADSSISTLLSGSKVFILYSNDFLAFSRFFAEASSFLNTNMIELLTFVYDFTVFGRSFNLLKVADFVSFTFKDYFVVYSLILKSFYILNKLGLGFLQSQFYTLFFFFEPKVEATAKSFDAQSAVSAGLQQCFKGSGELVKTSI
jgi:hypothetical protein